MRELLSIGLIIILGCSMIIDSKIVENAKRGDPVAFTSLYNMTYQRAYSICYQLVKNEDDACDILQDSYIIAFTKLNTLEDNEKFQGWFNRIVANNCKNFLKKKKPTLFSEMTVVNDDGDESEPEFEDISGDFSPDKNVDYEETKALLKKVIDSLPEDQRLCVLMYYVQDMTVTDIAEALDISPNTVKSRLNYARKKMKGEIEEHKKKGVVIYGFSGLAIIPFLRWMFSETVVPNTPNLLPKVISATSSINNTTSSYNEIPNVNTDSVIPTNKGKINIKSTLSSVATKIGVTAVAVTIAGAGVISAVNNKQSVNIEKYFEETIYAVGCNGYGRIENIESIIDIDELEKALCGNDENLEEYNLYCSTNNVDVLNFITISITGAENSKLSNGDEVTIDVKVDYEKINTLQVFEKDLKGDDSFSVKCKVDGLTDNTCIDLFSTIKEISVDITDKKYPLKINFISNSNNFDFGPCSVSWRQQFNNKILFIISYNSIEGTPKTEFVTMSFDMPVESECIPGANIIASLDVKNDGLLDASFKFESTEKDFQINNVFKQFGNNINDNINENSYQILKNKAMNRAETRFGKGVEHINSRILRIEGQNPCVAIFFYNENSDKYFAYEYANFIIDYEFNVYQPEKLEPVLYEVQQIDSTDETVTLNKKNMQTGAQTTVAIQKSIVN